MYNIIHNNGKLIYTKICKLLLYHVQLYFYYHICKCYQLHCAYMQWLILYVIGLRDVQIFLGVFVREEISRFTPSVPLVLKPSNSNWITQVVFLLLQLANYRLTFQPWPPYSCELIPILNLHLSLCITIYHLSSIAIHLSL